MKVHVAPRLSGIKGTTSVLEIELESQARRVRVRTSDGLESLDLHGERVAGIHEIADTVSRIHVPLRVSRDGPGRARVQVTLEDAKGALPPETWEGDIVLDAAPVLRRSRSNVLVGLGFAGLVGAIGWFVVTPLFQQSQVPSLVGRPRSDAERLVKGMGLAVVVESVDAPEGSLPDTVLGQKPDAGIRLGKDEAVVLTVGRAADADLVAVPSLVGVTEAQAAAALEGKGFRLRSTPVEASGGLEGVVNSQRPLAGVRLAPGSTVEIFVGRSSAPETRNVPNVVGLTPPAAEAALRDAMLRMSIAEAQEPVGEDRAGLVVRQEPAAGASLSEGRAVTVVVGIRDREEPVPVAMAPDAPPVEPPAPPVEPPAPPLAPPVEPPAPPVEPPAPPAAGVLAPDVLGLDRKAAQAAVRAAGLLWREIGDIVPDVDPEGIVVRQTPAAGKPVLDGNVELVVSRHAAKVVAPPAPDLVGRTEADARAVLTGSRYHVSVEHEDVDAPRVGLVLRQVPPAGTPTPDPEATWVEIVVGRLAAKPPIVPPSPPVVPPTPPIEPPAPPIEPPAPPVEPPAPPIEPPAPPVEPPAPPVEPPAPPIEPPTPPVVPATPPIEPPAPPVEPPAPPPPPGAPPTPPVEPPAPPVEPPAPPSPPSPGSLPIPSGPRNLPDGGLTRLTVPPGPPEPPMPSAPRIPPTVPLPPPPVAPPATPGTGLPPPIGVRPSEPTRVPMLADLDAPEAIRLAIEAGLIPQIVQDQDPRVPVGRVSRSSLVAGTEVRAGLPVTLSVGIGTGAPMTDIPNLVGLTVAKALDRLNAASIRTEVVFVRAKPGVFPVGDLVVAQVPVGPCPPSAGPVRLFVAGR